MTPVQVRFWYTKEPTNPDNPALSPQPSPYQTLTHQASILPALQCPRARYWQLGTTQIAQSLLKLFKPSSPKSLQCTYSAWPFLSERKNLDKALGHALPSPTLVPPDCPWSFPMWPCVDGVVCLLYLGFREDKHLPSRQSCPRLWSYHIWWKQILGAFLTHKGNLSFLRNTFPTK